MKHGSLNTSFEAPVFSRSITSNAKNSIRFVYKVMDRMYRKRGYPGHEVVKSEIVRLQDMFKSGGPRLGLNYSDRVTRLAYMYAYASARACITHSVLCQYKALNRLFDSRRVNVLCLGGGPGSELIGIAKYLTTFQKYPLVRATILDREEGWKECWDAIKRELADGRRIIHSQLRATFKKVDITGPGLWSNVPGISTTNLYVMSYCLSEFRGAHARVERFFDHVFSRAAPGSYFLFIDVKYSDEFQWFERLAARHRIALVPDVGGSTQGEFAPYIAPIDEQQAARECYRLRFHPRDIRLNLKVAYRLGRKREE